MSQVIARPLSQRTAQRTAQRPAAGASREGEVSLTDLLDRVLNKGVVLAGEIVISVAGVELIYIGVNALVSSVETLLEQMDGER